MSGATVYRPFHLLQNKKKKHESQDVAVTMGISHVRQAIPFSSCGGRATKVSSLVELSVSGDQIASNQPKRNLLELYSSTGHATVVLVVLTVVFCYFNDQATQAFIIIIILLCFSKLA